MPHPIPSVALSYDPNYMSLSCRHATASQSTVSPCMIPWERMPSSTLLTTHPVPSSLLLQSSSLASWKHCPGSSTLSRQLSTGARQTRSPYRSLILALTPFFSHNFQLTSSYTFSHTCPHAPPSNVMDSVVSAYHVDSTTSCCTFTACKHHNCNIQGGEVMSWH